MLNKNNLFTRTSWREANLLINEAKSSKSQKTLLEAKEKSRKIPRKEVDAEFKSGVKELKQIESRLTERATSLDRKDDI